MNFLSSESPCQDGDSSVREFSGEGGLHRVPPRSEVRKMHLHQTVTLVEPDGVVQCCTTNCRERSVAVFSQLGAQVGRSWGVCCLRFVAMECLLSDTVRYPCLWTALGTSGDSVFFGHVVSSTRRWSYGFDSTDMVPEHPHACSQKRSGLLRTTCEDLLFSPPLSETISINRILRY